MGRGEIREGRCRRHPNHRESQGVCPACLRERLAHLSAASTASTANASSTATTSSPSSSDSNLSYPAASPLHQDRPNTRRETLSLLLKGNAAAGGAEPLTKSRSLAFVLGEQKEEEKEKEKERMKEKKKKGRLWSMLMVVGSGRRKDDGGLLHSKTMKEKSLTKWVNVFS